MNFNYEERYKIFIFAVSVVLFILILFQNESYPIFFGSGIMAFATGISFMILMADKFGGKPSE